MHHVFRQDWEFERNGNVRPDGFSLHLSLNLRDSFARAHWDTVGAAVPDEYSRPTRGRFYEYEVDGETYDQLVAAGGSLRVMG